MMALGAIVALLRHSLLSKSRSASYRWCEIPGAGPENDCVENTNLNLALWLSALLLMAVSSCAGVESDAQPEPSATIYIDGEPWTLTRKAEECESREELAVAQYWKAPIFNKDRWVLPGRYLVNDTSECWIELSIAGITEPTVLFKVSKDRVVLDARLFSSWLPRVRPYPDKPIHDY